MAKGIRELLNPSDRHLVDYNYIDAAAGVTYLKYFVGCTINESGTTEYNLKPFGFHGTTLYSASDSNATGVRIDKTFETEVQRSIIVEGKAIVTFQIMMNEHGGGGTNSTYDLDVKLFKNTTEIASWERASIGGTRSMGGGDYDENVNAVFDVPRTHFKKGDDLKLEVVFTSNSGDVLMGLYVFHDPDSVTVTVDATDLEHTEMIMFLPVVPEL